ncbi:hypothetical protein G5V57_04330 [Nordella sp. HKS 07]|uniref:hypothetical protein n=1 Tax=Nordella sp. HKS 07 TaxID=2712222 RepID=UPI0013E1E094|nr:hypothetical protein [Nordella sp. HKS 07]QIG47042.1 hypothetical protein G5V57_04330 [Nordella sp. HKS 07]
MAAPATVSASGFFSMTRANAGLGEAVIRMASATSGTLALGGSTIRLRGDAATKTLTGRLSGQAFSLKIKNRNLLSGKVGADTLELSRVTLRPIPASEQAQFDAGPPPPVKAIFDATPNYLTATGDPTIFWDHFGNLFFRGRLDGSARLLCIASDPGPAECLPFARRSLIGDSGQKTQGFLAKLGLTRSYVLVNAFAVAMRPRARTKGLAVLKNNQAIKTARHALYDALLAAGPLQAIVAFGDVAQQAFDIWAETNPAAKALPLFRLAHPAAVDRDGSGDDAALKAWARAVRKLRKIVTPDADGDATGSNFGKFFTEVDYVRIPRWDFPKVTPLYVGDDSWGRAATPRHNNCAKRPNPDDSVSLILTRPAGQGQGLRYIYGNGQLTGAKNEAGQDVPLDGDGLEV